MDHIFATIGRRKQALIRRIGIESFQDQYGIEHALVKVLKPTPHIECLPLRSKRLAHLVKLKLDRTRETYTESISADEIVKELILMANCSPPRFVHNRATGTRAETVIDIGDDSWRSITVNAAGVAIHQAEHTHFTRYTHSEPLCTPDLDAKDPQLFLSTSISLLKR